MTLPKDPNLLSFLNDLFDTNTDFANAHDDEFFAEFKHSQTPRLTILKCSDSRVQMESFDKTPQNEVFAVRNIGNQLSTSEGSVDFGVRVLKTPFLLIIGHSGCGAVETCLSGAKTNIPAIDKELSTMKLKSTCMEKAIVENISIQVNKAIAKYEDLVKYGDLVVLGALYDFKNDFGFGKGRLVLTSINGIQNRDIIETKYGQDVKNLHFL